MEVALVAWSLLVHRPMTCGPYVLDERLARGGMGEVWRAHLGETPVAIKLVHVANPLAHRAFRHEVEAHARLVHPAILQVLDHGELLQAIPDGPAAGTPWLAMEFVGGGTLHDVDLSWTGVRAVLLSLLDALAYAHGQGVIHRDLKPLNVLLTDIDHPDPGIRLADFGIARAGDVRDPFAGSVVGSFSTMSPEQCEGLSRAVGPWTDLYALGCMGWRMCTHGWPFGSGRTTDARATMMAHVAGRVGPWAPAIAVPDGVEGWLRKLMQRRPMDRFRFAADAAAALRALPEGEGELPDVIRPLAIRARLPVSPDWRRFQRPRPPAELADWGQGLLLLRGWRTEGRDEACDALWAALGRVTSEGRAQAVVLRGPRGVGITHMVRWVGRAGIRLGRASVVHVTALEGDRPGDSTRRLLMELLGTRDVDVTERASAILTTLLDVWGIDDPELAAVARAAHGQDAPASLVRGVVRRLLVEFAAERPLIVGIDRADQSPELLKFVDVTLRHGLDRPVLFVVAVADGSGAMSDGLEGQTSVLLAPLGSASLGRLVEQSLPLSASLRDRVVHEAEGCPQRVRARLSRWIDQGRLHASPAGLTLIGDDEPTESPDDRVSILWTGLDAMDRHHLAVAACIGRSVGLGLWARVCDGEEDRPEALLGRAVERFRLQTRLARLGLIEESADGFQWVFGMDRAVSAFVPDPRAIHRAIADALERNEGPDAALDRARHRVVSEQWALAAADFERWLGQGGHRQSRAMVAQEGREAMARAGQTSLALRLACLETDSVGGYRQEEEMAAALLERAQAEGVDIVATYARAVVMNLRCLRDPVDPVELEQLWARCDSDDPLHHLTRTVLLQFPKGGFLEADALARADAMLRRPLCPRDRYRVMALVLRRTPFAPVEGARRCNEAADDMLAAGQLGLAYHLRNLSMEYALKGGDLELAAQRALATLTLSELFDSGSPIPMINLGQISLLRGDPAEGLKWLDVARAQRGASLATDLLTALEVGLACLVGDLARAWQLVERLPTEGGLQELPDTVLAPAADRVRAVDPALAERLMAFQSGW